MPTAVLHPDERARLASICADPSKPAGISLRTSNVIAEYSLVLAKSMRVSRNGLLNAILARGLDELIRSQSLSMDAAPLSSYFDPSIEISKVYRA